MTVDGTLWDELLEHALGSLLRMEPDAIEASSAEMRDRFATLAFSTRPLDGAALSRLQLTHDAARHAAGLWRGCIPQPGYDAAGALQLRAPLNNLCVTG